MRDVWSLRAAEVVTRLIAGLPADLHPDTRANAVRLGALPIGWSMWADYYLRPDGVAVVIGADEDRPDEVTVDADPVRVLGLLVWGSQRYAELHELLPACPADAADCPCCQHPRFSGPGKLICPTCGGVGWLPAAGDS